MTITASSASQVRAFCPERISPINGILSITVMVLIYLENEISKIVLYTYNDNPEILYIANLSVDANMRNKGIGTQLLSIAEDVADQMSIKTIILFVEKNTWMQKWYNKLGYKKLKIFSENPPLENAIWMKKDL